MYIITNPAKLSGKNGILKKIDLRDFYSYAAKNGLSGNTSRAIGKRKLGIENPHSCAPSGAQGAVSIWSGLRYHIEVRPFLWAAGEIYHAKTSRTQ